MAGLLARTDVPGAQGSGTVAHLNVTGIPVERTGWKQAGGGAEYSVCVTTRGDLCAWGRNNSGQLGDGTSTDRSSPVLIISLAP
jgi:alpha-tubulin suppressor-like RCC1 family protein